MRWILSMLLFLASFGTAYAGFEGKAAGVSLKIFDKINCGAGITCTRAGNGTFNMVSSPTAEAGVFSIEGAEATDGILNIIADESDDNGDDWAIKALASGNALSFQNNTSGSLAAKLAISTAGVLTLADLETVTNASDIVTIAGDDAAANLTLRGFEATNAILTLAADESDDNADDWQIASVASGNALTISNDTSGSQVTKLSMSTAGDITLVGGVAGDGGDAVVGFKQNRILATATTLTIAQCGSTVYNGGAIEIELPEASTALGCRFTFVTANAANFDIDPDDADQILVQTDAAGDKIRNATLGNTITIEAVSASQWVVVGILGTWADAN